MNSPHTIAVLDHGFVRLRNLAGPTRRTGMTVLDVVNNTPQRHFDADDIDPANAARMSFDQMDSDRTYEDEMRLTRYLMKNHHDTPFESVVVWLEYKLPIFVARQFVRHRTQALNEVSGRYVTLPAEWYIPAVVGGKPDNKKQGQQDNLDGETQTWFKAALNEQCSRSYDLYESFIARGVAPEHARLFLHLNHYTHWLSTVNLRNLMGFLLLRDHGHAQVEAQAYAKAITALLEPHIPGLMATYREFKRGEV
jgi:thymidylate synthase (FAD)